KLAWLEGAAKFGLAEKDQEESEKEGLRQPAQPGQGQPTPNHRAGARGLYTTRPAKHGIQTKYTLWVRASRRYWFRLPAQRPVVITSIPSLNMLATQILAIAMMLAQGPAPAPAAPSL